MERQNMTTYTNFFWNVRKKRLIILYELSMLPPTSVSSQ